MATAKEAKLLKLREKFDVEDHKKNPRGYTYIAIEKTINRFMEVDPEFEVRVVREAYAPLPGMTYSRASKPAAYALVTVEVTILGITRAGTGGDYGAAEDVDKLVKTAYAEAIKKAGHEFGVGLYLWDEEERALIESAAAQGLTGQVQRADVPAPAAAAAAPPAQGMGFVPAEAPPLLSGEDLEAMKNQVAAVAQAAGVQVTGPAIAAHFGVEVADLQKPEVLRAILEQTSATPAV